MNAAWVIRLTRLPADRNTELLIWKKITIATRPMMTGRAPLSPLRIRLTQIRPYSPMDPASSSVYAPVAMAMSSALPAPVSAVISSGCGGGFFVATAQPSMPLSGVRAGRVAAPFPFALPVVIRCTADPVSYSDIGPVDTRRPR